MCRSRQVGTEKRVFSLHSLMSVVPICHNIIAPDHKLETTQALRTLHIHLKGPRARQTPAGPRIFDSTLQRKVLGPAIATFTLVPSSCTCSFLIHQTEFACTVLVVRSYEARF